MLDPVRNVCSTLMQNSYMQAGAALRSRIVSVFQNQHIAGATLIISAYVTSMRMHDFSQKISSYTHPLVDWMIPDITSSSNNENCKRAIHFACWSGLMLGVNLGVSLALSLPLSQSSAIAIIGWTTFSRMFILQEG
jgi:hypothetical protein